MKEVFIFFPPKKSVFRSLSHPLDVCSFNYQRENMNMIDLSEVIELSSYHAEEY